MLILFLQDCFYEFLKIYYFFLDRFEAFYSLSTFATVGVRSRSGLQQFQLKKIRKFKPVRSLIVIIMLLLRQLYCVVVVNKTLLQS